MCFEGAYQESVKLSDRLDAMQLCTAYYTMAHKNSLIWNKAIFVSYSHCPESCLGVALRERSHWESITRVGVSAKQKLPSLFAHRPKRNQEGVCGITE